MPLPLTLDQLLQQQFTGFIMVPDSEEPTAIEVTGIMRRDDCIVVALGMRATHCPVARSWCVADPSPVTEITVKASCDVRHGPFGALGLTADCVQSAERAGLRQFLYIRRDPENGVTHLAKKVCVPLPAPDFAALRAANSNVA